MGILEKAEVTTSIRHIGRFLKSGKPIFDYQDPDMAGRKTRRRRRHAIMKRFAFDAFNAITPFLETLKSLSITFY